VTENPIVAVAAVEYAPLVLPEGWDEERFDEHGAGRVRSTAAREGLRLLADPRRVSEEGVALVEVTSPAGRSEEWIPIGPMVDGVCHVTHARDRHPAVRDVTVPGARLIRWEAPGQSQAVPALDGVRMVAEDTGGGLWRADVPTGTRIGMVAHGLGTADVRVRAFTGDGTRVGLVGCLSIDDGEVEVVVVPGTAVITLEVMEDDDERTAAGE
jgi:hypothetical protein